MESGVGKQTFSSGLLKEVESEDRAGVSETSPRTIREVRKKRLRRKTDEWGVVALSVGVRYRPEAEVHDRPLPEVELIPIRIRTCDRWNYGRN